MSSSDRAAILRALDDANVQFVVVGDLDAGDDLQLVVSRHPTNLSVLGRVLDVLGATLGLDEHSSAGSGAPDDARPAGAARAAGASGPSGAGGEAGAPAGATTAQPAPAEPGPRRVGDPSGTVTVRTPEGLALLVFGGERSSLYADTLERATRRVVDGVEVDWARRPSPHPAGLRPTGHVLGRRLLTLADSLTHLMERRTEPLPDDGGSAPDDGGSAPGEGESPGGRSSGTS